MVSAVKYQSCAFSGTQAVSSQLELSSGGCRVDLSAQQIRVARFLWLVRMLWFADGWTVGACVYWCTVAGLAVFFKGLRMSVDLWPVHL